MPVLKSNVKPPAQVCILVGEGKQETNNGFYDISIITELDMVVLATSFSCNGGCGEWSVLRIYPAELDNSLRLSLTSHI